MSNLNEEDIAKYQETKGLFEVREEKLMELKNGKTEYVTWYNVTNKIFPENQQWIVRDKETADDLCEYINMVTKDYSLDKCLPEPLTVDDSSIFANLAKYICEKTELIQRIQEAKEHELVCKIEYAHKCGPIKLHPDRVKEELKLSKAPTEKQINAYCEEKYSREFDMLTVAKTNTSLLNTKLDLINDYISLEKYIIRMELK